MAEDSGQAQRNIPGFCLLLLLVLAPWVASAYTSVRTDVLLPKHQGWHAGRQGWYGGLATGLFLLDDAAVSMPGGEVTLDLDPGVLTFGMVGYDLGALRFGQEVAWQQAQMDSISGNGMTIGVEGEISQLRLLSRNRLAFRLSPGSPHRAYASLGLGALKTTTEFADRKTGLAYDESHWAFVFEVHAGLVYTLANDDRLRIGIAAANVEPQTRVLFENWFNFRFGRRSPHRAYVGGKIGAFDSNVADWSLGYQLGGGMIFQIADRTGLEVGYHYFTIPRRVTAHVSAVRLRYNF